MQLVFFFLFINPNHFNFSAISEESKTDDQGNFQETFMKLFQNLVTPLLVVGLFLSSFNIGGRKLKQVILFSLVSGYHGSLLFT